MQENLYQELLVHPHVKWSKGTYTNHEGIQYSLPRYLFAMRNADSKAITTYTGSESCVWIPSMLALKTRVEEELYKLFSKKVIFTYAQLNWYPDGKSNIGWHSDKELLLGDYIASISLHVTRNFQIQNKADWIKKKSTWQEFPLSPGSLLVMNYEAGNSKCFHKSPFTARDWQGTNQRYISNSLKELKVFESIYTSKLKRT